MDQGRGGEGMDRRRRVAAACIWSPEGPSWRGKHWTIRHGRGEVGCWTRWKDLRREGLAGDPAGVADVSEMVVLGGSYPIVRVAGGRALEEHEYCARVRTWERSGDRDLSDRDQGKIKHGAQAGQL